MSNLTETRAFTVEIIDCVGPFEATTRGEHWNGFATPTFSFDVACDIALAFIARGDVAFYDEALDHFGIAFADSAGLFLDGDFDPEAIDYCERDSDGSYLVGTFGMCWTEVAADADASATSVAESLADAFVADLRANLTTEQFAEARARNAAEPVGSNCCHTHDFIDANECMAAAFEQVTGREPVPSSDADTALWNAAWEIAARGPLTLKATLS